MTSLPWLPSAETLRRLARRTVVRAAVGILVLLGLLWIAAARGLGMGVAVRTALDRFVPEGWTVEVGSIEGSWLSGVSLGAVSAHGPGSRLTADEVAVEYDLRPLLRRRLDVVAVLVDHPIFELDASADGDGGRADASGTEATNDEGGGNPLEILRSSPLGAWAVDVDELSVRDGVVEVRTARGLHRMEDLALAASGELGEEGLAVELDTLGAYLRDLPSNEIRPDVASSGELAAAMRLRRGLLTIDRLDFRTTRSDITVRGSLPLLVGSAFPDGLGFELSAAPLDLRDLPVALPQPLLDHPLIVVDASGEGGADTAVATVRIDGPGDASTTLRASLPAASDTLRLTSAVESFDLTGWAPTPFDGIVRASVEVAVPDFDLRTFPSAQVPFNAAVSVRHTPRDGGSGLILEPLRMDVDARRNAPSGEVSVDARLRGPATMPTTGDEPSDWSPLGGFSASITGGAAEWRTDLSIGSGRVSGSGRAAWGGTPGVEVDSLSVLRLDLAALTPDLPSTDITGALSGRASGIDMASLDLTLSAALDSTSLAGTRVDSLALDLAGSAGSFDGTARARLDTTLLETTYRVGITDSVVDLHAPALRVRTEAADSARTLHAFAAAQGRWWLGSERRRGELSLRVDSARAGEIRIEGGEISGDLAGEELAARAAFDLSGFLDTRFRIEGDLGVTGLSLDDAVGRATVAVTDERSDSLRLTVRAEEPRRFRADGTLALADAGALDIGGLATVSTDTLSVEARIEGDVPTASPLLAGATVDSVRVAAFGTRVGEAWEQLRGDLVAMGSRWRAVVADTLLASVRLDSGDVMLDTLGVASNVLAATGGGRLSGDGIVLTGRILDIEPLRPEGLDETWSVGESQVQATVTGRPDSLHVDASARLGAAILGRRRAQGIDVAAEATLTESETLPLGLGAATAEATLRRLELGGFTVRDARVLAEGDPDSVRVTLDAQVDDDRHGSVVVKIDPRPDRRIATFESVSFQLDEDQWEMTTPAVFSYLDGYHLDSLRLATGEQQIFLQGGVDTAGTLDMTLEVDSTDIGTIADLAGFPTLDGWIGGNATVTGSTERPEGRIDLSGAFHRPNAAPAPISLELNSDGTLARATVVVENADGGRMRLEGTTGSLGAPTDTLSARITAEEFRLRWFLPFMDPRTLSRLDGRLVGDLTVDGSRSSPALGGDLRVDGGVLELPDLGVVWEDVNASVRADGSELVVDSLRATSGGGDVSVAGRIDLEGDRALDLVAAFYGFQAIDNEQYSATLAGRLRGGGTIAAPELTGDLRLESLDVYLDERVTASGLEEIELTEDDLRMLRDRFGYVPEPDDDRRPLVDRLTADLNVELGRDSWLRKRSSPEMSVAFSGDVQVSLRPGEPPTLQGSVETIAGRGFVEQFGRRFELREGTVVFEGPPEDARLDLSATYTIPSRDSPDDAEATIVLSITGTQQSLDLELSSEPPMENADIVSYIATGRPASGTLAFGGDGDEEGGGLAAAGANVALGQLTGVLESAASQSIGLDVVEIRREGLREATLVAGKYLSPRLYVGFAQPVMLREGDGLSLGDEGESEVEIELQALRWLLLNVEGSGSALRIFVRGRHAY